MVVRQYVSCMNVSIIIFLGGARGAKSMKTLLYVKIYVTYLMCLARCSLRVKLSWQGG